MTASRLPSRSMISARRNISAARRTPVMPRQVETKALRAAAIASRTSCSLACGTVAQACCVYGLKLSKRSPVEASTQRPSTYIWQVFVMVAPSRSGRSVRAQIDYTCIRTYTYPCTHGDGPVAGRYRRTRRHPHGVAQSRLSTGGRIMERIAVIGLGQMGGAIATRLHSQGLGIVGFDSNEAACREFAARGASVAGSV